MVTIHKLLPLDQMRHFIRAFSPFNETFTLYSVICSCILKFTQNISADVFRGFLNEKMTFQFLLERAFIGERRVFVSERAFHNLRPVKENGRIPNVVEHFGTLMSQQFTSNLAGFQGTRFENETLKYSRQLKEWKTIDKKDRNLNFIRISIPHHCRETKAGWTRLWKQGYGQVWLHWLNTLLHIQ